MTEQNENAQAETKKPFQIKNRTLPIVLLLVVLPWMLLALPGYVVTEGGKDKIKTDSGVARTASVHRSYGWPLTHAQSSHVTVLGKLRGGQYRPGEGVTPPEMNKLIDEHLPEHEGGFLNLIPSAREGTAITSLWTDSENMPLFVRGYLEDHVDKKGLRMTWNIPMLIVNCILMALAAVFVGYIVERVSSK